MQYPKPPSVQQRLKNGSQLFVEMVQQLGPFIVTKKSHKDGHIYILSVKESVIELAEKKKEKVSKVRYDIPSQQFVVDNRTMTQEYVNEFGLKLKRITDDLRANRAQIFKRKDTHSNTSKGGHDGRTI